MDQFTGFIGIAVIFIFSFLLSNNRKAINYRTVTVGLLFQVAIALFILKVPIGKEIFAHIGHWITRILEFSDKGAEFVFGPLVNKELMGKAFGYGSSFIFFVKIIPTIIFVCVLVNIGYYIGFMQRLISLLARVVCWLMGVSGAEALSNVASIFVGQIEAQIVIAPYLPGMTKSELFASMSGSMACIAGGIMAVYIQLGIPAEYLIAASVMAAPGALVIAKIIYPETEVSETKTGSKIKTNKDEKNLISTISEGAESGLKIGLSVITMLIAFISIIFLLDFLVERVGNLFHVEGLNLKSILGYAFSGLAWCMGVPKQDIHAAGSLMGSKFVINEFVAYIDLLKIKDMLAPKSFLIVSFALCGFANLGSVAIQLGGIGQIAPSRKAHLAKLGFKALLAGTLASYLSATIAGIITG